ncbi:MAG: hypothetical protein NVS1B11_37810 [Terriglobales bacterium]
MIQQSTAPEEETSAQTPDAQIPTGKAARKIIDEAIKRWKAASENEQDRREVFKANLRMLTMEQWSDKDRQDRESIGRPVMIDDRLSPAVQALVNNAREARPSAKVHPIDEIADKDTANVIEGGIRHIEYASQASIAYDAAFEPAAGCGWGWYGFTTEYCDDGSFDNQEIEFRSIPNALSVYKDTSSVKADASDMLWCCVIETITHDEYINRFGGKDDLVIRGFKAVDESSSHWVTGNDVVLCEYWRITLVPRKKLYIERRQQPQMQQDGSMGPNVTHLSVHDDEYEPQRGDQVLKSRDDPKRKVEQFFLTADEVKAYTVWLGKWIPLVQVSAKEVYDADGKLQLISAIEHAIPNQQKLNVYSSFEAESVALAGRPKWLAPIGSFKTKAKDFANHNRTNVASLEYDLVQVSPGVPAAPPEWITFNPQIEFCLNGMQSCITAIQASTMVFDPELGHNSTPDQSGTAINALQKKAQQGNYHLIDNLTRSQWHGYKILIDLFPKIYDTEREIGWLGANEKRSVVKVNQTYQDPKTGKVKTHMLDAGSYGVVVEVGPSYDSQRLEVDAFLAPMIQEPEIMQKAGDIIVRLKDLGPLGDELAARLAPPGLADDPENADDPTKLKMGIAQLTQQHQQMTLVVHQLMQETETKQVQAQAEFNKAKMQAELSSFTSIAVANIAAKTAYGQMLTQAATDKEERDLGFAQNLHDSAHEAGMAAMENSHTQQQGAQQGAQDQAASAQDHAQTTAQSDQEHQQGMQQQGAQQAHDVNSQSQDQAFQAAQAQQAQDAASQQPSK